MKRLLILIASLIISLPMLANYWWCDVTRYNNKEEAEKACGSAAYYAEEAKSLLDRAMDKLKNALGYESNQATPGYQTGKAGVSSGYKVPPTTPRDK